MKFNPFQRQFLGLITWGIAFGMIEAAVVIYLRQIYYPEGFQFPVIRADFDAALVEIFREFATLVLMGALAVLLHRKRLNQIAVFMIVFGIWDIFYYVFLKIFLNWPPSFATWDILFLLPCPWVGPVWPPVFVSMALIYSGYGILAADFRGKPLEFSWSDRVQIILAGLVIVVSFLIPGRTVAAGTIPRYYPWYLFGIGFVWGVVVFEKRRRKRLAVN